MIEAEGYTFIDQETWSVELLAEQLSSQKISFNFGNVLKIYFDNNNLLIQRKHWNMKGYDEVQVEISLQMRKGLKLNLNKQFCKILYLIFDYPYKHYTFKYFEV